MIKPLEESSPKDRAFFEYMQQLRRQPPQPWPDPGPLNWEEIDAILSFRLARRTADAEG